MQLVGDMQVGVFEQAAVAGVEGRADSVVAEALGVLGQHVVVDLDGDHVVCAEFDGGGDIEAAGADLVGVVPIILPLT